MKKIAVGGTGEVIEKKSRFIANVFNIDSEEMAVSFINEVKKKYWDARHNCFAYVIGENNELQRFSDDGEPSGTAGKPILEIITNSEVHNCLIVVTRYFGGTLLGTGGLIRAYQSASKEGILASEIIEELDGIKAELITNYNNIGKLQYICSEMGVTILDTLYGENVNIKLMIPEYTFDGFEKKLADGFSGTIQLINAVKAKYTVKGEAKL